MEWATVLGIVPAHITFDIGLSDALEEAFDGYIKVALGFLENKGIEAIVNERIVSLEEIIFDIKRIGIGGFSPMPMN